MFFYAYDLPSPSSNPRSTVPERNGLRPLGQPIGKFPVLVDGKAIVRSKAYRTSGSASVARSGLILPNAVAAVEARRWTASSIPVMNPMEGVNEGIRTNGDPDPAVLGDVRARLERVHQWLPRTGWPDTKGPALVTLIECAACPLAVLCRLSTRSPANGPAQGLAA